MNIYYLVKLASTKVTNCYKPTIFMLHTSGIKTHTSCYSQKHRRVQGSVREKDGV